MALTGTVDHIVMQIIEQKEEEKSHTQEKSHTCIVYRHTALSWAQGNPQQAGDVAG